MTPTRSPRAARSSSFRPQSSTFALPDAEQGSRAFQVQDSDNVWHYDFGGDGNVVESYISYLRRKIDTGDTQLIHTVRGVGYVLRMPRS